MAEPRSSGDINTPARIATHGALTIAERRSAKRACVSCEDTEPTAEGGVRETHVPIPFAERHRVLILARPASLSDAVRAYRTPHYVCAAHALDLPSVEDVCRPAEIAELLQRARLEEGWPSAHLEVAAEYVETRRTR